MSGVISPVAPTAASTPPLASSSSTPAPAAPQPGAAQFGQFRLTTFVDSNPNPMKNTVAGKRKSMSGNLSATQSPVPRPSSVPAGPEKGGSGMAGKDGVMDNGNGETNAATTANGNGAANHENASPITGSAPTHKRATSSAPKIPTGQHNGFGVLDLTPPLPPAQGKLGQHRDGRVRNPVPRKLKGKTDMRNGNFSVMHMNMSAHGGVQEGMGMTRGEQAQRTSENTAKAAREALKEKQGGGGSVKRRRVDGDGGWEPILSQASQVAAIQAALGGGNIMPVMPKEIVHRTEQMTPEEVKYEQARLLTLLRSLSPLTVVDQICTALAFFGGIPGAPPPAEGVSFPQSEDANGNGSLFVGWLSEIFPDSNRRQWSSTRVMERAESIVHGKRPRGRPKGSKASKVRKDKGIKKGRKDGLPNNAPRPGEEDGDDPADDDWVDIAIGDNEAGPSGNATAEGGMIIDLDGDTPSQAAGKRKVGRPRGSTSKPKKRDADGNDAPSIDVFTLSSPSQQQQNHTEAASSSTLEQSPTEQKPKRKPGRPPGSKTKPKEGAPAPTPEAPKTKPTKGGQTPTRGKSVLDGSIPSGLAADERAVLEAYRKNKALTGPAPAPEDASNKKKRKSRAKPKPTAEVDAEGGPNGEEAGDTPTIIAQQLDSHSLPQPQQPQPTPVQTATPVPPPPVKRQRKAKEPTNPTASAAQATNNASNIDPSLQASQPPSASPHVQPTRPQPQPQARTQQPAPSLSASQAHNNNPFASPPMNNMNNTMNNTMMSIESMMPSSTQQQQQQQQQQSQRPAQGLEAHYERFANQDSQSQSPNTYTMGGVAGQLGQGQQQRASPSVAQMMQRTGSQGQRSGSQAQQRGTAVMRSPQKSATMTNLGSSNTSNMYYGGTQPQAQQQQGRHIPSQSTGYGYNTGMQQNNQASRSNSYNLDAFGPTNSVRSSMNQLPSSSASTIGGVGGNIGAGQRGNSGYGVQAQQNQGYFDGGNIAGASYVDLPALETGLQGTGGYGVNPRSATYGGSAMTGNMGGGLFGTEGSGITESEMRERLLRGIGRR